MDYTYPFLASLLPAFFKEEDEAVDGVDDEEQASALFTMLAISVTFFHQSMSY